MPCFENHWKNVFPNKVFSEQNYFLSPNSIEIHSTQIILQKILQRMLKKHEILVPSSRILCK